MSNIDDGYEGTRADVVTPLPPGEIHRGDMISIGDPYSSTQPQPSKGDMVSVGDPYSSKQPELKRGDMDARTAPVLSESGNDAVREAGKMLANAGIGHGIHHSNDHLAGNTRRDVGGAHAVRGTRTV